MRKLIFALFVVALLVPMAAFATTEGPGEPPDPNCKWVEPVTEQVWVEPVTEQVWVEPVTEVVVVVDQEAYNEVIKGACYPEVSHQEYVPPVTHEVYHPAVTHEECTLTCPTVTWPEQEYQEKEGKHWVTKHFGPITFTYDKSSDPNKCHRPTASSLGVPPKLENDFNQDFPQLAKECAPSGPKCVADPCYTKECKTVVDKEARTEIVIDVAGYWKTVVDKEAYCDPDTTVHHDAVTHEETVTITEGYFKTVVITEGYYETVVVKDGYWDCPVPPEPTCETDPSLCPPPPARQPECKWEGTGVGVFELWSGPKYTGDYALMYVYDFGDGLPEGVSVDRQECVLGWTAQTDTGPWEITRNTCTGQLSWHGLEFTPGPKVIREKSCDRSQECLK